MKQKDLAKEYIKKKFKRRNKEIENAFNAGRRSLINEIFKLVWNDNIKNYSIAYTLFGHYMIYQHQCNVALCNGYNLIEGDYRNIDEAKKVAEEHYKKERKIFIKDPTEYIARIRGKYESAWKAKKIIDGTKSNK